jgi:C4-dicarboxylate transporter DctM subunit
MAGFGAGLIFALNYAIYCYFYAKKTRIPLQPKATTKEIIKAGREALWGLGIPFIILGGIYSGVFTPTESAAVAVAYAMFVTCFIYRELSFRDIWEIGIESSISTARVLIMVAAATLFSWLLTVQGITAGIVEPVVAMKPPYWAVMAFANLSMLIAGMFVDVFSNILILTPLLLRLMDPVGVSELHFGIVATVNSDMGNITPPFGLNLFVASGAFNKNYIEVVRAVLPWIIIAIISLMIITYIPEISLWLPKQLYPGIK